MCLCLRYSPAQLLPRQAHFMVHRVVVTWWIQTVSTIIEAPLVLLTATGAVKVLCGLLIYFSVIWEKQADWTVFTTKLSCGRTTPSHIHPYTCWYVSSHTHTRKHTQTHTRFRNFPLVTILYKTTLIKESTVTLSFTGP